MKKVLIGFIFLAGIIASVHSQKTTVVIDTNDGSLAYLYLVDTMASFEGGEGFAGKLIGTAPGTFVFPNGIYRVQGEKPYNLKMNIKAEGGTQYWTLNKMRWGRLLLGIGAGSGLMGLGAIITSLIDYESLLPLIGCVAAGFAIEIPLVFTSFPRAKLERVEY